MEQFEKFSIVDDNFGGPLVQIRNKVTGEENWCRRSRVHLVGTDYILTSERQAQIMRGVLARQKGARSRAFGQREVGSRSQSTRSTN